MTLTDFLQFFILIPLGFCFVLLVSLFLFCVVSIHHLLIWRLKTYNIEEKKEVILTQLSILMSGFQFCCLDLVFNIVVAVDVVVDGAVHLLVGGRPVTRKLS